jgi:hypothetical protein
VRGGGLARVPGPGVWATKPYQAGSVKGGVARVHGVQHMLCIERVGNYYGLLYRYLYGERLLYGLCNHQGM